MDNFTSATFFGRDKSYRGRISEKINPEDISLTNEIIETKNKEKSWRYGEYPEYHINFISISKDGTLGEIYKVGDLYIGLPSVDGKEIINKGLPSEHSIWQRAEVPKAFENLWFDYKSKMVKEKGGIKRTNIRKDFVKQRDLLVKEHKEFVDAEFERREHGIFIKIDDEVMYFTGEYWMFLQHYYLTESNMYGYFRVVAMEALWHWEAVRADSRVWGEIRGKGRRTSWSVESASMGLNELTITKYAEIPIVSERKDLASKLFSGKIVNSFEYYPIYFKPLIELPDRPPSSNLQVTFETQRRESSTIDFYPTKETAYDSLKVKSISINDEIGKWEDTSLTEFIARHSRCHTEGGATARFGSTAGKYAGGGGKEFEDEYLKADANSRNALGRTDNGLVAFFIDICYTMTQPISYFDGWGYSIVHDPVEPIENENGQLIHYGAITDWQTTYDTLKKQGEKTSLNAFLRDMPRTIEHMFRNEGGMYNDFDIENLNNHSDYIQSFDETFINENKIFRGNLEWEGEHYNSNVRWQPHPRGKFKTTWIPDKEMQNKYSTKTLHGIKLKMPDNDFVGCFGVDPYDGIGNTADGNGSDGAIVGYSKFSMSGAPSHSFFLIYKERPDKRDDFFDDVIMACQFFSISVLVESNKSRLLEYMWEKGYSGYSLRRQDKPWRKLTEQEQKWGGMPSSKEVIADQASLLKSYIFDYVGQNLDSDCKVWFIDLIEEWKKFNLQKRKEFDLGVASGFAIMAAQYSVKQRSSVQIEQTRGFTFADFGA